MSNINSNQKGKVGEREARDLFKKHGFENARRSQQYSGAGFNSFDIVGMPKLGIEVKRVEGLNIFNAMNQAIEDSKDFDVIPTVIHRKNHKKWKVSFLEKDYKEHFKLFEKKNLSVKKITRERINLDTWFEKFNKKESPKIILKRKNESMSIVTMYFDDWIESYLKYLKSNNVNKNEKMI